MRLTEADYWKRRAALDVVSYGKLKAFDANPRAFRLGTPRERTEAMIRGSLLDCLLFERDEFCNRFDIRTVKDSDGKYTLRSNAAKAEVAKIEASGRIALHPDWWNVAEQQLMAIYTCSTLPAPWSVFAKEIHEPYLSSPMFALNGTAQLGIAKASPELGLTFVAKPDFVPAKDTTYGDCLVDLKLVSDIDPKAWERKVVEYAYHWQAASYLDLWNAENPDDQRSRFIWLLVENKAPYDSGLVECSWSTIETGRQEYTAAAQRYARCLRDNHWPSPLHTGCDAPVIAHLPKWYGRGD